MTSSSATRRTRAAERSCTSPGCETAADQAPAVVGHGASWEEAIDDVEWRDGDVLVVGSSSAAPAARVFLGSRASRIIRHSPVPVLVVPR
jgi:nucleotide-binding universal stress UspA family protein